MNVVIKSIAAYVPENKVTNDELAKTVDTSDEWIVSHTGIKSRHIVAENQTSSELASAAAKIALERAGVLPEEIDLIVLATASPDYIGFPSTACIVQDKIKAVNSGAIDVTAGCTGFIYALEMGRGTILSGTSKNVLVIGVEVLTKITNWKDRNTCVLFGDGAGAVVLSADTENGIIDTVLKSEGQSAESLMRKAGGIKEPYAKDTNEEDLYISMDGRKVYNFAVRVVVSTIKTILEKNNLTIDDISYIVPHQANIRIIQATAKRLKYPMEKFYTNIHEYANTSAASIPIALNEMYEKGKLKKGDLILTVGFGAGLTYGANLIKW